LFLIYFTVLEPQRKELVRHMPVRYAKSDVV